MTEQTMDVDSDTRSEMMDLVVEEEKPDIVAKVLAVKPRYIGIYAPGDFSNPTFRLAIPDISSPKRGRGFQGAREDVFIETLDRAELDGWISALVNLINHPGGPVAIRHLTNPACGKDEGIRLVWPNQDGLVTDGAEEIADWPRRDELIKDGKAVHAEQEAGNGGWMGELFMAHQAAMGMGMGMPMSMGRGMPMPMPFPMPMPMPTSMRGPFGPLTPITTGQLSGFSTPLLTPISPLGGYDPYPTMQVDQVPWCQEEYLAAAE